MKTLLPNVNTSEGCFESKRRLSTVWSRIQDPVT